MRTTNGTTRLVVAASGVALVIAFAAAGSTRRAGHCGDCQVVQAMRIEVPKGSVQARVVLSMAPDGGRVATWHGPGFGVLLGEAPGVAGIRVGSPEAPGTTLWKVEARNEVPIGGP